MATPFALQDGELELQTLRRHWLHIYPRLSLVVLAGLVPAGALWFGVGAVSDLEGTARNVMLAVCGLWLLGWSVRAYFLWYRYQHDIWVLTDQRLVDSLKRHWLHHSLASTDLVDIEDVSVERSGPLRTVFDYGDVQVQTAANTPNFVLAAIPKPREVLTAIDRARDEARRSHFVRP